MLTLKNMKGHDMNDSDALSDNEEVCPHMMLICYLLIHALTYNKMILMICNAIIMEQCMFQMEGNNWLPEYHAQGIYQLCMI